MVGDPSHAATQMGPLARGDLRDAVQRQIDQSVAAGGAPWAQDHLSAWGEVFKRFGAKPQRTPCSAQALPHDLRLHLLHNASVTCNDGSPAG